jgi:hypothetical protein
LISEKLRKRIDKQIKSAHYLGPAYSVPPSSYTYGDWSWGDLTASRSEAGKYRSLLPKPPKLR